MPNFFQAIGQSNINQSVGQTIQYLQQERANQLAEKKMGLEEQQIGSQIETQKMQRNLLETQIADAARLREKVNVDQLMGGYPFKDGESAKFLLRNAKMMGLVDPDGFTTRGDLQKFGEFLKSPETMKTMNRLIVNDSDAMVSKLKGLMENPDAMKESGMKPDDLQAQLQQAYAMQAKVHTAYSNQEDSEKLFDNFPPEIKSLASAEGIDPTRVRDPARLAAMMGTNLPRWRKQLIAEHVATQKQLDKPNWAYVTGSDGQPKKVNLDTYQLQPNEKPYAAGTDNIHQLNLAAKAVGVDPVKAAKGDITQEEANKILERYAKDNGLPALLKVLGIGAAQGSPVATQFDSKGNPIK